jgi:hypothetical protein
MRHQSQQPLSLRPHLNLSRLTERVERKFLRLKYRLLENRLTLSPPTPLSRPLSKWSL